MIKQVYQIHYSLWNLGKRELKTTQVETISEHKTEATERIRERVESYLRSKERPERLVIDQIIQLNETLIIKL